MIEEKNVTLEDCLLKGIVGRTFRTEDNIEYSVINRPVGFIYHQGHKYLLLFKLDTKIVGMET